MTQHKRRSSRLLTAGYLTLDLIVRDLSALDYWHAVGGTCGNVSVFVAALGGDVSILARVGQDRRGRQLLSKLKAAGVNTSGVERVTDLMTPGIVELVRAGKRREHKFSFNCPVCGARLPKAAVVSVRQAKVDLAHVDEFDAFFFDRATTATVRLAEAAREAGLLVVFEPRTVPRTYYSERAAALSDIVKVAQQPNEGMDSWRPNRGASTRFVIETLGSGGVRFRSRIASAWSAWRLLPAVDLQLVRDPAGAGDWLTAGLITACLSESCEVNFESIQAAIEYGQSLSAISLAFDGPQGALMALEPSAIERIARDTTRTKVLPTLGATVKAQERMPRSEDYCGLCLSAGSGAVINIAATD